MRRLLRHWKMILGLMAIFAAGVGTGAVGMVMIIVKAVSSPVVNHRWTDERLADLDRKLVLTPEQKAKIRPIVLSAAERFRALGNETFEKLLAAADQTYEEVARELTPEQRVELEKMRPQAVAALRDLCQREISVRSRARRFLPSSSQPAPPSAKPQTD
jgi:hypothetical protein